MILRLATPPRGLFRGTNLMTPNVTGYFKLRHGYAELSHGRGIDNDPIFGVTVRPDPDPRRSQLFYSQAAAMAYIEELS